MTALESSKKLNCSTALSERSIGIQCTFSDGTSMDLVPKQSSYLDWTKVCFPSLMGTTNRTWADLCLQGFYYEEDGGAHMAVRDLKAFFRRVEPCLPNFLLEYVYKRAAESGVCEHGR